MSWFLLKEQIERFRLEPLQYVGISEENVHEFEDAKAALASGRPLELQEGAAEYAPQVIHSIVTGTRREIHANVPNRGLIDNLPEGAVIEVPHIVDGNGSRPCRWDPAPMRGAQPLLPQCRRARDRGDAHRVEGVLVRQAVLVDPNASSTLTPEQIWALCDELTAAHGDLIPEALR